MSPRAPVVSVVSCPPVPRTSYLLPPRGEQGAACLPERAVVESVDEGIDRAVEVVGSEAQRVDVVAAVSEMFTPVDRLLSDEPEK